MAALQRGGALWKQLVAWPFIFAVALVAPYLDRLLEALDRWLAR